MPEHGLSREPDEIALLSPEGPCGKPDGLRYTREEVFVSAISNMHKYLSPLAPRRCQRAESY